MSVYHDIKHLSHEELRDIYEIEVHPDGKVRDPISGKWFDSLLLWAQYEDEQSNALDGAGMEKFRHGVDIEYWD